MTDTSMTVREASESVFKQAYLAEFNHATRQLELHRQRCYIGTNALVVITALALASINILGIYGYLDLKILSIINVSTLGLGTVAALTLFPKKDIWEEEYKWKKGILYTAAVVLAICAGLSSLGIFKVFNTTQVSWTVFAPIILGAGVAFWNRISKQDWAGNPRGITIICASFAIMTINVLALTGIINGTTLGMINTGFFASVALFWIKDGLNQKNIALFLIFGILASISGLGISGHLSIKAVAWTSLTCLALPTLILIFLAIQGNCLQPPSQPNEGN